MQCVICLDVFGYITTSKKFPLVGPGIFYGPFFRCLTLGAEVAQGEALQRGLKEAKMALERSLEALNRVDLAQVPVDSRGLLVGKRLPKDTHLLGSTGMLPQNSDNHKFSN